MRDGWTIEMRCPMGSMTLTATDFEDAQRKARAFEDGFIGARVVIRKHNTTYYESCRTDGPEGRVISRQVA